MPKRIAKILVEDILERIERILAFTDGMTFKEFEDDEKTYYAVDRCFEIIGEAANKLPDEFILNHPEIEWQ
ncbi:MAG: HepT-like ribonuclease domain-containing protein [Bacteroidota bacterium]|nr:HepT-like ribonuclease domain-containing protein [Bacteroidota bacterium]